MNRTGAALLALIVGVLLFWALFSFVYNGLTCGGTGCP
jgi:hypothetical protein